MSKKQEEHKKLPEGGYKFSRAVLGVFFKLYYNPRVINKEVIPREGPIIICGNHKHVYDQCPVILSTKRVVHYMAKKTNATIVPFGITGDYKFRSKNLTVRFGTPFKVGDMTLEEANEKLYNEIGSLMKESLKEEKEKDKNKSKKKKK